MLASSDAADVVERTMDTIERQTEIERLYRQAFAEYGAVALWNMRPVIDPTPGAALAITPALRTYGSMDGRRLAEHIELLCRAPQ
jgi:hypothetical protein